MGLLMRIIQQAFKVQQADPNACIGNVADRCLDLVWGGHPNFSPENRFSPRNHPRGIQATKPPLAYNLGPFGVILCVVFDFQEKWTLVPVKIPNLCL